MSKHKPIGHIYICLCDIFRPSKMHTLHPRGFLDRPYRGRYAVCAKNEKHALKLLREVCPFGSLQVYYQNDNNHTKPEYGKVIKEC